MDNACILVDSPRKPVSSTEQMHIHDLESLQPPREGLQQRPFSAGERGQVDGSFELSGLASLPTQSAATPQRRGHDTVLMSVPASAAGNILVC